MKTSHLRHIRSIVTPLFCSLILLGCIKEGPAGPPGASGSSSSNIQLIHFELPLSPAWTSSGTSGQPGYHYKTTIPVPELTTEILLNGDINASLYIVTNSDTLYGPLPYVGQTGNTATHWWYTMSSGQMHLKYEALNGQPTNNPGTAFLNSSVGFKVVLNNGQ